MLLHTLSGIMHRLAAARPRHISLLLKMTWWLPSLLGPTSLRADTISGTVQDPSGAVIASAQIEITGGDLQQPVVLSSDGLGRFASADLKPGAYSLRVIRDGFEPL